MAAQRADPAASDLVARASALQAVSEQHDGEVAA